MDDGRIGHAELRARRRRALPGRRVSRDRTESACTASDFGEPDAGGAGHRRRARTRPGTRSPGAAGAVREPRRAQRHDHRPVRSPLDAQRSDHRRRDADPARRRRLRLGVDAGRRPRRGVLRPRARVDVRPGQPSGHQHQAAHRHLSASPAHHTLFCCYAVADLEGARQAIVDGGGTVDELEQFDFGTLRGATDPHGTSFARVPAGARHAAAGAQWRWARRAFVHHLRGGRLGGVQGVLQPGAVLDVRARPHRRRLADSADPSDGRCRGRQRRSR